MPEAEFNKQWSSERSASQNFDSLSQTFKVSRVVVARRALDLGKLAEGDYSQFFRNEEVRWEEERRKDKDEDSGGNFYNTLPLRNGARFTQAVVSNAIMGSTLLRDAGALLNMQPASVIKYYKKAASQ